MIRIEFINTTLNEKENNLSHSFEIQFSSNNKERELYYWKIIKKLKRRRRRTKNHM